MKRGNAKCAVQIIQIAERQTVHFADVPIVFESTPSFFINDLDNNNNSLENNPEKDALLLENFEILCPGNRACQKDDQVYVLRPHLNKKDSFSCFGIFTLIIGLLVLFGLIWFVVDKILLLEVEKQIEHGVYTSSRNVKLARFSSRRLH